MRVHRDALAAYGEEIHICELAKTHGLLAEFAGGGGVCASAGGPGGRFGEERWRENGGADGRVG